MACEDTIKIPEELPSYFEDGNSGPKFLGNAEINMYAYNY
jgi:hypothetical protein